MRVSILALAGLTALAACNEKPAATETTTTTATPAATTAAVPGQDWTQVTAATPEGGFRMGNPDAKVKLVEYASLTCPHCKDFHEEAAEKIKTGYVATGNVSYEYRNFVLNGPDLAATLLARCQGPTPFFNLVSAFYAAQAEWTAPFMKMTDADGARIGAMAQDKQAAELAKLGQLDGFMRARGMTKAKFDQCLADPAALKIVTDTQQRAATVEGVNGTPTFFINGVKMTDPGTWANVEAKLKAALA
ncbi:DsbA family protein [Glacieibacterium frigidum]|uniref:DsbA family protein n=1 Tax=Glacieibacterium frigidum TaxID=2593303 RepID=A0A552UIW9_9SPHN|nr:DsbA family protein [Glacieibacterium frigidum]TRW18130.1 DsbA family protein [Glacieibacterium frigidum]